MRPKCYCTPCWSTNIASQISLLLFFSPWYRHRHRRNKQREMIISLDFTDINPPPEDSQEDAPCQDYNPSISTRFLIQVKRNFPEQYPTTESFRSESLVAVMIWEKKWLSISEFHWFLLTLYCKSFKTTQMTINLNYWICLSSQIQYRRAAKEVCLIRWLFI